MQERRILTADEIDQLFAFAKRCNVTYYDIQMELVDHLAADIENILTENPKLNFEEAKKKSFAKFGSDGFSAVVDKRHKALREKYRKILMTFVLEWFKFPKIMFALLLSVIAYVITSISKEYMVWLFIALEVFILIKIFLIYKVYKKRKQLADKKWMFEEVIYTTGVSNFFWGLFLVYSFLVNNDMVTKDINNNIWYILIVSIYFVLFVLMSYVSLYVIPAKAKDFMEEQYPEYNLV